MARIPPEALAGEQVAGSLIVDIRPVEQRHRDGDLQGALVIDRNVLEWRLAPSSPNRVVDLDRERKVIVVCNEGYQSSLAAATLRRLGVDGATDLIGGYQGLLAMWGESKTKG
jgi:rhodanese-related sulfurtransferase